MNSIKWIPTAVQSQPIDDRLELRGDSFILDGEEIPIESDASFKFQTPNWGNKATQVQTIGKHTNVINDKLMDVELNSSCANWRYDEEYFAIQHKGQLFIYNEDGELYSKHEHQIANIICWYKHRVMTIQRRRKKLWCVFVEPNGLEHGTFAIPYENSVVVKMATNEDQTTVMMEILDLTSQNRILLLWICMNAEWYISNAIHLDVDTQWYITENSVNFNSKMISTAFQPIFKVISTDAQIAVIQGKSILFTNLNNGCIPPPYCHLKIECDEEIIDCCFSNHQVFAISHSKLFIKNISDAKGFNKHSKYDNFLDLPSNIFIGSIFAHNNQIVISSINSKFDSELYIFNDEFSVYKHDYCVDVCTNNEVLVLFSSNISLFNDFIHLAKIPFSPVKVLYHNNNYFFLSTENTLHLFNKDFTTISSKVSSFTIYNSFLVVTLLTDDLCIYDLNNLDLSYSRPIEHGSIIISCHLDALFVQLPRGNLESFSPRPFIIHSILQYIKSDDLYNAVELSRQHRIDFNLLFDIQISPISKLSELIVKQCTPERINLILTSLNDVNCINTLYKDESELLQLKSTKIHHKQRQICSAIRDALIGVNSSDYLTWSSEHLQSLLTATIRDTANTNKGLMIIHAIMTNQQLALQLLKYCIFLTDKQVLFKMAYESYDLEFVEFVGRHCGVDPNEYLPFLGELKQLPENEQHYKIDIHIEEYGRAAIHLFVKNEMKPIIDHVTHYQSFKKPIKHMINNNLQSHPCWDPLWTLYGDYLTNKRHAIPAAICYAMAKDNKASEVFVEQKYYLEGVVTLNGSDLSGLYELLDILEDPQGIYQILTISRTTASDAPLLDNVDPFLTFHLTGNTTGMDAKLELIKQEIQQYETKIKTLKTDITRCRTEMESKLDQLEKDDAMVYEFDDVGSVGSVVTSRSTLVSQVTGLSRITFKTGKTSKSKKKSDRKQQGGRRKGTIYEEVYLINEFSKLLGIFNAKLVDYKQFHTQLYLVHHFKEGIEFYGAVYDLYKVFYDAVNIFETSLFNKQMTILGRSNAVTKQDLAEYAASASQPMEFPGLASKPVWLHFQ